MHAESRPLAADTIACLVDRLAKLLAEAGLTVSQNDGIVRVENPAADTATEPSARAMNPGMKQRVALREHEGELWWWWLWAGPERGGPPDPEPMVPASDVNEATRRIVNVLAVAT